MRLLQRKVWVNGCGPREVIKNKYYFSVFHTTNNRFLLHLLLILCLSCAVRRVCVCQLSKCALLLSVHCCKNKQDLQGFQHCSNQMKQSSAISAGRAQSHAALFQTRRAATEIQPCKSLTAKRWSWYKNLLKERNLGLISQSDTSSNQGRHKGISEREKSAQIQQQQRLSHICSALCSADG